MELLVICATFVILAIWLGKPKSYTSTEPSRETLNEVCPNEGTGDFAYVPNDDLNIKN